jgi:hypothetical protein
MNKAAALAVKDLSLTGFSVRMAALLPNAQDIASDVRTGARLAGL